ncbi:hypothetical protein AS9A_3866 [Hoyosella subflava DQS3-9A1]|uniref:Uncharacterized protein n=1 Tax=Hoyosella subflava (strain DSM 45089 / JCM 17490 / NBRC 109087 / DQS3-9A1) TaxID=443218 RepID=F6EGR6_HOYSD|nr:hypothetical protein AS9A_3866 [Hoyosella subflava DQS3-9A1]
MLAVFADRNGPFEGGIPTLTNDLVRHMRRTVAKSLFADAEVHWKTLRRGADPHTAHDVGL